MDSSDEAVVTVRVLREDLEGFEHLFFQWSDAVPSCPACFRDRGEPHRSACWIARALGSPMDAEGEEERDA